VLVPADGCRLSVDLVVDVVTVVDDLELDAESSRDSLRELTEAVSVVEDCDVEDCDDVVGEFDTDDDVAAREASPTFLLLALAADAAATPVTAAAAAAPPATRRTDGELPPCAVEALLPLLVDVGADADDAEYGAAEGPPFQPPR